MQYITLNNGIKMPILGLGVYQLQGKECEQCILDAIELGYRLFDTAQMYGNEKAVGAAIKKSSVPREELFITTKLYRPSNSYQKAKKDIEVSLKNLQLDYIDLFLIHEPYSHSIEMYQALEEAYHNGKIKAIGVSNYNASQYKKLLKLCKVIPAINQVECHIFYQQNNLNSLLSESKTVMEARSPLAAGKNNIFNQYTLMEIGKKYRKTAAQIGLKYLIQKQIPVIPKTSHQHRMKENIDIFDFNLSKADMSELSQLDQNKSLFGWYD